MVRAPGRRSRRRGGTGRGAPGHRPASGKVFWLYWGAATISSTGDAVTVVALPLTAVTLLRASSFDVSVLIAARYAAWILIGLPAGVIVGRLPLRGTQVTMDLLRAGTLLSVPVAAWAGAATMVQLGAVALVIGLAGVVFDVGNSTLLPSIVPREQLTARNSLTSGSHAATQLAGPSLGGVLVQIFGAATSLIADVASYLASAALLLGLPRVQAPRPGGSGASMMSQIRGGLGYVARHPVIRPCVAAAVIINFVCGALMALTPVFLVRTLGAPAWLVGVAVAAEGLGSLAGAALTPRLATRLGSARALLAVGFAGAVSATLMPLAWAGWGVATFALGNAGFAAGVVVFSILTRTHRHVVTPPELLPRVMATVRFLSWGVIPAGALAAGLAAGVAGNRGALWLACVLAFAAPVVLLASRVRGLRHLADARGPAEGPGQPASQQVAPG